MVFDGVRSFEYGVAAEVWGIDRSDRGVPAVELRVCSVGARPVRLMSRLTCDADHDLSGLDECDLVVVPGMDSPDRQPPPEVLDALRRVYAAGATIASLCTGAFVLAAAGLLDGRRATTHWLNAAAMAERYPMVEVDSDVLFVGDGPVWTSAGTAAGIDLCLHLVRLAHGAEVAGIVARSMVTAPFRGGGQRQFIPMPVPAEPAEGLLDRIRADLLTRLDQQVTVPDLARTVAMSERTFARRFTQLAGTTPLQWVLTQRVAAAQRLLETSDLTVDEIARRCGFADPVALRRHFARQVGLPPREYRRTFRAAV